MKVCLNGLLSLSPELIVSVVVSADWQDEFSSDVEPSPREMTSEEEKAAPSAAAEKPSRSNRNSEREEECGLSISQTYFSISSMHYPRSVVVQS